jgi:Butirosin biosynthesis protein H, N-terminal/Domain of unknown function (DUF4872)
MILHVEPQHFGGLHCETASLRKLLLHQGVELSEELLFGLGGGMGFIYWQSQGMPAPFVGGRNGRFPDFVLRIGEALGRSIEVVRTGSARRAYQNLVSELSAGRPALCYGDIFFLPYFHATRHFGGHAFIVYGVDEQEDRACLSDRRTAPQEVTLADLARARSSETPPFPPRNALLRLPDGPREPAETAIREAIRNCREALRNPPISSFGLPGILKLARVLDESAGKLDAGELLDQRIGIYVDLELAGTGGCAFRKMYRAFLAEAAQRLAEPVLEDAVPILDRSIAAWQRFLDGLLPPVGPGAEAVLELLRFRDLVFREALPPSRPLWLSGEARAEAAAELDRHREKLRESPSCLEEVHRAESDLVDLLERL